MYDIPAELAGARIALGFSGGVDSVCLFHLMARCGMVQATLTVDHALQAASADWAARCEQWSAQLGVPHQSARVQWSNNNDLAQLGLEEAARNARYVALERLAKISHCTVIALAHHADDQAETVLLQALRGAGLQGLSAMPVWRELRPGLWLWRPLLHCHKSTLHDYAAQHCIDFIEDPSNQDNRLRRNALRHLLVPVLEDIAPAYRQTLARVAHHASQAAQLIDELAEQDWLTCRTESEGLEVRNFRRLSSARQANVLRAWCQRLGLRAASQSSLADMLKKISALEVKAPPTGAVVLKFEGFEWRLQGHVLHVRQSRAQTLSPLPVGAAHVNLSALVANGRFICEALGGVLELHRPSLSSPESQSLRISRRCLEQAAAANAHAQLRLRSAGSGREVLRLQANRPSRRLKNLFQESRQDIAKRNTTPLLYVNEVLVAVLGLGVALDWQPHSPQDMDDAVSLEWRAGSTYAAD